MGNTIRARDLLEDIAQALTIPHEQVERLFMGTPLDFPLAFAETLPLWAHRFGMVGITLWGTVHLRNIVRNLPPIELLALLRHEAEHVRQQEREPFLFYPRYAFSWLLSFLNPRPGKRLQSLRVRYGRGHAAYRAIPYEEEAYAAGDRMRTDLQAITQHYSQDFF